MNVKCFFSGTNISNWKERLLSKDLPSFETSESDINRLLQKVYGFKRNKHRNGRITWDWLHDGRILVYSVVSWKIGSFDLARVAQDLGLESEDLKKATAGNCSRSCLLLILFIYQLHRHLGILAAWTRNNLLQNSSGFLQAIGTASVETSCCELIGKQKDRIIDITGYSDTQRLGEALTKLITGLGC